MRPGPKDVFRAPLSIGLVRIWPIFPKFQNLEKFRKKSQVWKKMKNETQTKRRLSSSSFDWSSSILTDFPEISQLRKIFKNFDRIDRPNGASDRKIVYHLFDRSRRDLQYVILPFFDFAKKNFFQTLTELISPTVRRIEKLYTTFSIELVEIYNT